MLAVPRPRLLEAALGLSNAAELFRLVSCAGAPPRGCAASPPSPALTTALPPQQRGRVVQAGQLCGCSSPRARRKPSKSCLNNGCASSERSWACTTRPSCAGASAGPGASPRGCAARPPRPAATTAPPPQGGLGPSATRPNRPAASVCPGAPPRGYAAWLPRRMPPQGGRGPSTTHPRCAGSSACPGALPEGAPPALQGCP